MDSQSLPIQQGNPPPKRNNIMNTYDALSLFSGGLDSILATKLMQSHGHRVLGLHFVTPFFGKPEKVDFWRNEYGIDVELIDVGQEFVDLMAAFPPHGFGKVFNPCVDCKILMLRRARDLMPRYEAKFLISGEVIGQRPMSQRSDTLNIIRNDAEVRDVLLRPLSAGMLSPHTDGRGRHCGPRPPAVPERPWTQGAIRPGQGAGHNHHPGPGRRLPSGGSANRRGATGRS